jgi:type IV secretion system protein VirB3
MSEEFDPDVLFLALSRPAMKFGVPATGLLVNLCVSLIAGGWIGIGGRLQIVYTLVIGVTVHLVMKVLIARDYNIFRILALMLETRGRSGFDNRFGGASATPLPAAWPKKAKGLRISG